MNKKATEFQKYLDEKKIVCFKSEEIAKDTLNTVVFRSLVEAEGQQLPMAVILDSSIYCMIRVRIAPQMPSGAKEADVLKRLNDVNKKFKVFKYYLADDGGLYLDSCLVLTDEKAVGEKVYVILEVLVKHLQDEYKKLMQVLWA
ncbi:MAG: hypothetical protein LKE29_02750 [Acidaminococcaceae bacterium]|nr:hypothetical protein [Acidaminococcaceae bacterium]